MGANIWDWLANWAGFVHSALYTIFYAAGAAADYYVGQLVLYVSNAWSWTNHSFEKLTEFSTRAINTFTNYTNAAVRPMAVALSNALIRLQAVVASIVPGIINAIGSNVHGALQGLWNTSHNLYVGLSSLPAALNDARAFAGNALHEVDKAIFDVETRAFQAFDFAVAKLNVVIDWVNATHHESGVFRRLPIFWTLYAFINDIWMLLLSSIASNDARAEADAYAAAHPVLTHAQVFDRAHAGAYSAGVKSALQDTLQRMGQSL